MSAENTIIPFIYDEKPIRIVKDAADNLWFVAKDVANALGYAAWDRNLVGHIPGEWKGVNPITTPGGVQEMITLSEPGLFFFLARSDKPLALPFQKWLAGEVLPSIRKTGAYHTPASEPPPELYVIVDKIITVLDRMVTVLDRMETQHTVLKKNQETHPPRAKDAAGLPAYENLQAAWRRESSIPQEIQEFILQYICLIRKASSQLYEIWHAYKQFCATKNYIPQGRNTFYATLHQAFAGYSRIKTQGSKLYISGIALKRKEN